MWMIFSSTGNLIVMVLPVLLSYILVLEKDNIFKNMVFNSNSKDSKEIESQDQYFNSGMSDQTVFPLLEERLVVNLTKQRVGEIVVRKEIETHIITVKLPVRNEKVIVEQVSPQYIKLAEVNLGELTLLEEDIQDRANSEILQLISRREPVVTGEKNSNSRKVIKGYFNSLEDAHNFLDLVFSDFSGMEGVIRVELISKTT